VVCWSVCLSRSWALQKRLNRSKCSLGYGLGWAQGSVREMGRCTFAPPVEYHWTVHLRRRCDLFVELLWPLVIILASYFSADSSSSETALSSVACVTGRATRHGDGGRGSRGCSVGSLLAHLSPASSPLSIIRLYGGDSGAARAVTGVIYCHSFVERTATRPRRPLGWLCDARPRQEFGSITTHNVATVPSPSRPAAAAAAAGEVCRWRSYYRLWRIEDAKSYCVCGAHYRRRSAFHGCRRVAVQLTAPVISRPVSQRKLLFAADLSFKSPLWVDVSLSATETDVCRRCYRRLHSESRALFLALVWYSSTNIMIIFYSPASGRATKLNTQSEKKK